MSDKIKKFLKLINYGNLLSIIYILYIINSIIYILKIVKYLLIPKNKYYFNLFKINS